MTSTEPHIKNVSKAEAIKASKALKGASASINGGPEVPMDSEDEAQVIVDFVAKGQAATEKNKDMKTSADDVGGVAGKRLRSFIERIERLTEEKQGLADDIKDVYAESKGAGFDVKTIRKLIRLRKMEPEKRREEAELEELYKAAIGMS